MPITALPTPPSRQDPANFAERGDALLGALPAFVTEANALAADVTAKEAAAASSAASASSSAGVATTKAAESLASANAAAASVASIGDSVAVAQAAAAAAQTSGSAVALQSALAANSGSSLVGMTAPDGSSRLVSDLSVKNDGAKGAALIGFYDSIAPSYLKTQSDINNGLEVSIFRFIAPSKHAAVKAFTSTDDLQSSFTDAFAAARRIYIPFGKFNVSGTTSIAIQLAGIRGDGAATWINSTVNSLPIFTVPDAASGLSIDNLKLTRSVSAIAGGDGIFCSNATIGQASLTRLIIEKQYNGLSLGPTDFSVMKSIVAQNNIAAGIYLTNTSADGACQWTIHHLLAQKNGAQGIYFQSIAGPTGCTLGSWNDVNTYANSGAGIAVFGTSAVPVNGVRISKSFVGNDGNSGIYLNTYGGQHSISDVFAELTGTGATGPTLSSPASNIGSGIEITTNNADTIITACHANGNSHDGFSVAGADQSMTGCRATNNGLALSAGKRNGINCLSGITNVTGGRSGNTGAGVSQQYGVFAADGNNCSVQGVALRNNAVAPTGASANHSYMMAGGNLPNSTNVQLSSAGAVLVGGGATGDWAAAGTINVAGGLFKNDVAYTNP